MMSASFTDFFKTFFRDEKVVLYGLWERHVDNWLSGRDQYDILLVKYEDLIAETGKEIMRVAEFIGCNLSTESAQKIAEKTSFKGQKKEELFKDQSGVTDSILRKGVVGDWQNHFVDKADAELMNRIAEELYKKHRI